jgi:3-hydroxyethyl bacteriochlorophyllide a dehydrogenase
MNTLAVVLTAPECLTLSRLDLMAPGDDDVIVDVEYSGISTGTERLLYSGRMPPFPGLGYPLVPGYETVGRISHVGGASDAKVGSLVFVPGARCFNDAFCLFGGAAARLIVPSSRITQIDESLGEKGVLLALAATAYHVTSGPGMRQPELIIGHGVLGRLLARIALAAGAPPPVVWETNPTRRKGAVGYSVIDPAEDPRRDYNVICDVSGDSALIDTLISRLAPGGELILAGFYSEAVSFAFPPAFMREARLRVAAEWRDGDLKAARDLIQSGAMTLDGLITNCEEAADAPDAYRTAFNDANCLKMILDWRAYA